MTKRRPLSDMTKYEFMWVPCDGAGKESAIVHGGGAKTEQEIYAAVMEQLFKTKGADAVASLLAAHLRLPTPHRDVIATVARWLDPQTDDYIKLVVVRRRSGKSQTKHVNDAAIAEAILRSQQEFGRGNLNKKAVSEIADQFKVSEAKIRQVISQIRK